MAVLPTASKSPLEYACELWVFAMCPALRGSTVSYAGDAQFPKHSLEYSLNFWSQSKKKSISCLGMCYCRFTTLSRAPNTVSNEHYPFVPYFFGT